MELVLLHFCHTSLNNIEFLSEFNVCYQFPLVILSGLNFHLWHKLRSVLGLLDIGFRLGGLCLKCSGED